ncbi:hypothetical protein [Aquimarina sediminis]|uniref:hypothetical protein n=1 Tax=Aquimarina sediminis TaxID=2070536 RepID=UPI000FFE90E5|nr:hypothetical protein [Aquimarina sediminis]
MIHRKTNLKIIWQRAKLRPRLLLFAFQGIAFSLFLFIPIVFMMSSIKNSFPYVENVEEIASNGIKENAVLIDIEPIGNVTINGDNPTVLIYEFDLDGQKRHSKFSVFDPKKIEGLKKGDVIAIKHFNEKSIVLGYEQYSFSMDFIYYIASPFLVIGLVFCFVLYTRIKKEIGLYKTGRVREGKIISISHNRGFTFSKFGLSMDVHYEYDGYDGENKVDKSRTNNFALTNNKAVGDVIRILVSQDGKSSCLYPELIAKTNGWKEN